jgi:hypothetical protein
MLSPFPPIHLSDGAGNWLRCGYQLGALTCGDHASLVCGDCGPLCETHQQLSDCFHSTKNHQALIVDIDESRYPIAAILAALNSRRITVENGIQRLRASGAPECVIDSVLVIESEHVCSKGDYAPLLREIGAAA